jgi:hypothetical protein
MTDTSSPADVAFEKVVTAMRNHLEAVKAAGGQVDDDNVWNAYVELNNASYAYDDILLDMYGEVTPWDVDLIDPESIDGQVGVLTDIAEAKDPHARVVSVRQRRDYRVPSVSALLKAAEGARRSSLAAEEGANDPVESVGEAVLELLQSGDGSLAALDIPELEPHNGLVAVVEVETALDLDEFDETDGAGPFAFAEGHRLVGRLDEQPYADMDGDEG